MTTPEELAAALGVTPRRVNQLAHETAAARNSELVDAIPIIRAHVKRLAAKVETAGARRDLLQAQAASKKLDTEIRDRERVPVAEVRALAGKLVGKLYELRQHASGLVYYSLTNIHPHARQIAGGCDESLLRIILELREKIDGEIEAFITHRSRRLFR